MRLTRFGICLVVFAVATDGRFARDGCPALDPVPARQCAEGARTVDEPLETFS